MSSHLRNVLLAVAGVLLLSVPPHAQVAPAGVQEPAWSPDGRRIAVSYLDRLWTMTPDGKQARAIFQDRRGPRDADFASWGGDD